MKKPNFGHYLFFAATLFVAFIAFMVSKMLSEKVDLVDKNYYEKGLEHQKTLDDKALYNRNIYKLYQRGDTLLALPDTAVAEGLEAKIMFYRPSDSNLDFELNTTTLDNGKIALSVPMLQSGLWQLKISWAIDQNWYFAYQNLNWQ